MIAVTVEFIIHPEHLASFRKVVLLQAANSLAKEPGCRQFDVCFDPDDANRCFLYEKYDDPQAFAAHLASSHFQQFDATVMSWIETKTVATWQLAGESPTSNES